MSFFEKKRFPKELGELFNAAGYSLNRLEASRRQLYIFAWKWLFLPSKLFYLLYYEKLPILGLSKANLVNFWVIRKMPYAFIRPRYKETCKLTCFDLNAQEKHVYWSNEESLLNDCSASLAFEKMGFKCPPFDVDIANKFVCHKLVGDLFRAKASLNEIAEKLIKIQCAHLEGILQVEDIDFVLNFLKKNNCERLNQELFQIIDDLRGQTMNGRLRIPLVMSHGDPSDGNFLLNAAGEMFVTDFDRFMVSTVFHDLVFLYLGSNGKFNYWSFEQNVEHIFLLINSGRFLDKYSKVKIAVACFVCDTVRYIANCKLDLVKNGFSRGLLDSACDFLQKLPILT